MNHNGDDDEDFVGRVIVDTAISLVERCSNAAYPPAMRSKP